MANQISLEITRLAQSKVRSTGAALAEELARCIVEESVMELDPELDLVIDNSQSWTEIEGLSRAVGVNDVVIKGRHIDVRTLSTEGTVEIHRALVGTSYLTSGSLVVSMDGLDSGSVVGYIGPGSWLHCEQQTKDLVVSHQLEKSSTFDLGATLAEICNRAQVNTSNAVKTLPNEQELANFIAMPDRIINARQKQIISTILSEQSVRTLFEEVSARVRRSDVNTVMSDAAVWSRRVENVVERVSPKFDALSAGEVRNSVRKTGELFGGQTNAPKFRKHLISDLTREQLVKKFHGAALAKVADVVEQVFSGKSALDSVRHLITNTVAVDLAAAIKHQRQRAQGFTAATADEIGMAFKQLSLQPSYATHSTSGSGVDTINEALQLLEAAELAEQAKALDDLLQ